MWDSDRLFDVKPTIIPDSIFEFHLTPQHVYKCGTLAVSRPSHELCLWISVNKYVNTVMSQL